MPSVNLQISPNYGPIIDVVILPSAHRLEALQKKNMPLPNYQLGTFLIDTGASNTCIDESLLSPLDLTPTGVSYMQTPSTNGRPVAFSQYDVQILIPSNSSPSSDNKSYIPFHSQSLCVGSSHFLSQGIHGLIGRDVLEKCILVYNGHNRTYALCW